MSIEPSTGFVKAMIGGPDFADSQYNIATHPIGRQPGSTWKVITLAGALQNGYSPDDIVDGTSPCSVPKIFPGKDATTVNAEEGGGPLSLWDATAGSVNCAFVRLSTSVGQAKLIKLAHKMGIAQVRPAPTDQFLTLSIGTVEATPLEMATVMATVANGGVHHTPVVVQKVIAPDGKVLIDNTANPGDVVLDRDVANCEANVLRGVVTHGTGGQRQRRRGTRSSARRAPPTTGPTRGSSARRPSSPPRCGSATAPATCRAPASVATRRRRSSGRS